MQQHQPQQQQQQQRTLQHQQQWDEGSEGSNNPAVHSPKAGRASSQRAWEEEGYDAGDDGRGPEGGGRRVPGGGIAAVPLAPGQGGGGEADEARTTRTPSPAQVQAETGNTDPVIKYMVRPPLSEEKLQRDWMRDAPTILSMLKMTSSPQDQYAGMQQMVQLARQNAPEVWSKYFGQILLSLLEGIGHTGRHPNQMSPSNGGGGVRRGRRRRRLGHQAPVPPGRQGPPQVPALVLRRLHRAHHREAPAVQQGP